MGYAHIENLYRPEAQIILAFRECYALEKIHGTSSHVSCKDGKLHLFAGGESHERFVALFRQDALLVASAAVAEGKDWIVFGEAYGGKQQDMSATYGKELRFVAFDVKIGECWLDVPSAAKFAEALELEFVPYNRGPCTLEWLNEQRDLPSRIAVLRGITEPKIAEGIVIRPPFEVRLNNGERVCAKHKRPEFSERKSKADTEVDPAKRQEFESAQAIAEEWVTAMRLTHVLDKRPDISSVEHTGQLIQAVVEDILREGAGEVADTKANRKAIGALAASMFKKRIVAEVV